MHPGNLLVIVLLALTPPLAAQERIADYDDSIRLEYNYSQTSQFTSDELGTADVGTTDTHAIVASAVWSLNEKWKIYGSVPYVQKRHEAGTFGVHDWRVDFVNYTPPDLRVVDDGDYHGGFQDFTAGIQYLAVDSPFFSLSPFVSYGVPTRDYPIYGSAIIGRGLKELHLGVAMDLTPYFSDWYFQADVAYAFSERVLGVDLDYWHWYFSASYFVTPRLAPRIFVTGRNAPNALDFVQDVAPYYDSEIGWRHDQTLKHNFINAGIGVDYIVSDRYQLSGSYLTTIEADNVFETDFAVSFALTRRF